MNKKQSVTTEAFESKPVVMVKAIAFGPHPQVKAQDVKTLLEDLGFEACSEHSKDDLTLIQFKGKTPIEARTLESAVTRMAEEFGARFANLEIRLPAAAAKMNLIMVADSMKAVTHMEWKRELSRRESRGGMPLTREQIEDGLSIDRRDEELPEIIAIENADDLAVFEAELRLSLDKTLPHEITGRQTGELVNDAHDGSVITVERLSATLADTARIPVGLARMIITGARRPQGARIRAIEEARLEDDYRVFHGRTGELSGNPGFQRMVRDCTPPDRDPTKSDAFRALFHFLATASAFHMRHDARLAASDEGHFSTVLQRAIAKGDIQAVGDIYAQLPRRLGRNIAATCRAMGDDWMGDDREDGPPFDVTKADMLATEPVFNSAQMLNYGSRWRRLDAPDHIVIAEGLDEPLLPYAWVRTMDDTEATRDFDPFRNGKSVLGLPGEAHDHSDVAWIVGLGPDPWHVEPMYITIIERNYVEDGRMELHIHNTSEVAPNPHSRLTHDLQGAMAVALHSQFVDDMEWQYDLNASLRIKVDTTDPVPRSEEESERLLSYRFMQYFTRTMQAFRKMYGKDSIVLLKDDEYGVEHEVDSTDLEDIDIAEKQHDLVSLRSQIHSDSWGAVAVETDSGPLYIAVPAPDENDGEYLGCLEDLKDDNGKLHIDDDALSLILEDLEDLEDYAACGIMPVYLQAAMTLAGRVMIARDEGLNDGITFHATPPGVIPVSLLTAKLSKRDYASGYDHVYSEEWIKEMDEPLFEQDEFEADDSFFFEGIQMMIDEAGGIEAVVERLMGGGFNPYEHLDDPEIWESITPTMLEMPRRFVLEQLVTNGSVEAQSKAFAILEEKARITESIEENDDQNAAWSFQGTIDASRLEMQTMAKRMVDEAGCEKVFIVLYDGETLVCASAGKDGNARLDALKQN